MENTLMKNSIIIIALILSLTALQAKAFHADFFLVQQSGSLLTGRGANDPGQSGLPGVGVRYHVNEIAGFAPFVDVNPGYRAEANSNSFFALNPQYQPLPGGRNLGFNLKAFRVEAGAAANLFYWDGMEEVDFQPVVNPNDFLNVRSSVGSVIAAGTPVDVSGFEFTATDSTGFIHDHLVFDFDADNNAATPASTGVFLASFEYQMDLDGNGSREIARPHYAAWFNGPPGTLKTSAIAAANNYFAANFAELRLFGDVSPLGDDSLPDDTVDDADIDALLGAVRSNNNDPLFDLNTDELVDASDVSTLFGALGTQYGDANLDGSVDGSDLALWQANYGSSGGWAEGDFDGSVKVDGRDFLVWQRHAGFGENLTSAITIPEPESVWFVLGLVNGVLARGRLFRNRPLINAD
jgi:hypothetical protein